MSACTKGGDRTDTTSYTKGDPIDDGLSPVPSELDEFTPEWCEWALRKGGTIGPNVTVITAKPKRLSNEATGIEDGGGMTDAQIIRVKLTYGGETTGSEPNSLVAKWFHGLSAKVPLKWRLLLRMMGQDFGSGMEENLFRCDIHFYREVIPFVKDTFQHPKVYYTGIIDGGNRSFWQGTVMNKPCKLRTITLMQDMNGWESFNFEENFVLGGLDTINKEACLKNIAVLHAAFWGKKADKVKNVFNKPSQTEGEYRCAAHKWYPARERNSAISSVKACESMIKKFLDGWTDHIWMTVKKEVVVPSWFIPEPMEGGSLPILKDATVLEMLDTFAKRYPAFNKSVAEAYIKKPMQTLVHGDFHAGNHMYGVDNDKGKIVSFDFQCVGLGMVAVELIYFLAFQGTVEDFIPMAKVYHDALVQNGVTDYKWEEFKKDVLIQLAEFCLKMVNDFAKMPPKKFMELMNVFGDKFAAIEKLLECGAFGWPFMLLTEIYLKNKDGFLIENAFTDV